MNIDHIGIVVKNIEDGIKHWHRIFNYKQLTKIIVNTRQKIKVVFLEKENSMTIKLIEPIDKSSPVFAFAKRGGGLHHLCFKCDNLNTELARVESHGLRVIVPPQPGEAFDNEDIAFIFAKMGLNIELIDTDKKTGLLIQKK
jgi:methylmalonyl-CoA/ethylmalonyl-CoA epimerase